MAPAASDIAAIVREAVAAAMAPHIAAFEGLREEVMELQYDETDEDMPTARAATKRSAGSPAAARAPRRQRGGT